MLALAGPDLERFSATAAEQLAQRHAGTMLSAGIQRAYEQGVGRLAGNRHARQLSHGIASETGGKGVPALFSAGAEDFLVDPQLSEEVFGPASLLIACKDVAQMHEVAERLEGQLTATLQMSDGDHVMARDLLPVLERKVGRILVNGFPTGVEVSYSMVHGGPFPATSDSRGTSVGTAAIQRFLRPVSYQNLPQALLPAAIQDGNPLAIWQRINGQLKK